ncbi:BLUF domain-containing protein [Aerophototrophica crusticola]|uniref:BLUF domain-containing protein n=1 Tax=Aerophototrophica crusticola TaxID=1709002 RepID=A0A858RA72_9PROT|nr:BLUF domain-containing protein [Rhodospirillaceae bacterium B3]
MSEDGLLCLVYVSRAAVPLGEAELLSLLRQARNNNSRDRVTGMLLYRQGRFMQALEGPNALVQGLYRRIQIDPRHTQVTTLIKFQPTGRAFDGWSMGFQDVDRLSVEDRSALGDGLTAFLDQGFEPATWADAPHQAIRLLRAFRDAGRTG